MQTIQLLGMSFYPYGLAVAGAAAAALLLAAILCRKDERMSRAVSWFAVLAVPLGVAFARLGYCLASYD